MVFHWNRSGHCAASAESANDTERKRLMCRRKRRTDLLRSVAEKVRLKAREQQSAHWNSTQVSDFLQMPPVVSGHDANRSEPGAPLLA